MIDAMIEHQVLWTCVGIYLLVAILVIDDVFDDGVSFYDAAARGLLWPVVFAFRLLRVLYRALREVAR